MVAAMEVPPAKASSYGMLDIAEDRGVLVKAKGMVEKPSPEDAPSNLAVIGRYILTPDVLTNLNKMKSGAAGENPTDRRHRRRDQGRPRRLWCAVPGSAVRLRLESRVPARHGVFALGRDDLRDDLHAHLEEMLSIRQVAE